MRKQSKNKQKSTHLDNMSKNFGFASYVRYLQSDHWGKIRRDYLESGRVQKCIACLFPQFYLHHVHYGNFGNENLNDLIPLCNRCHRVIHKVAQEKKMPSSRPDLILQIVFGWTDQERIRRFVDYVQYWEDLTVEKKREQEKKQKKFEEVYPRHRADYYKISKDLVNFKQYVKDGYTVDQLAKMYKVEVRYVNGFMLKYKDYFQ